MLALWIASCLLALFSLLLMGALISVRVIAGLGREEHLKAEKNARHALVSFASEPNELALLKALEPIKRSIISDQVQDVVGLVRGELIPRLRSVLITLNLQEFESNRLRRSLLPNRIRAAEFLGYFGDERSVNALRRALKDRSSEVRVSAAIALARQEAHLSLPAVLAGISVSHTASGRLVDFFEIVAKKNGTAVLALLDDPHIGSRLKALAVEGICRTKAPNLVDEILEYFERVQDTHIRAAVIRGCAIVRHRHALDLVRDHLDNPDGKIRLAAAEAAELLGVADDRIIEGLVRLMDEEHWLIRFVASNALASLGDEGLARLRNSRRRPRSSAHSIRASELILINLGARNV